ncbi:toxin-antitoxin system, antitoxin component [Pseudomonas syringae ICMP 11293]|uniref:hypothetical protein n=1 Tax=Pseudomonas syringae group TaxID=136849 RepID=UPI0007317ED3|nr:MULTISPECIES: hypothetical protein [Pseudomonas syringae group]KTB92632.1 toxin-antitoxin system, antitoxin component [Pseudomonas syringae ICMP 11293]MCZ0950624.1 toxin-antitoxin system, antitoxin component [Pseudomonas syringae pv. tomato]MDU8600063.1 toxin-antitoxin system, antitoxin component [Pseudomonas syringae]NAO27545.1 toxin-antitoxin system, antitoxin component [Pseudomonas syringae pv. dysoxyli]PHN75737.1 toxin-antitoxin system, antitoxin component [Pseudomonas syringae]
MPELLTPYDPAHAMIDPQAVAIFLTDALQAGDAGYVGKVLGMAAHAKGIGVIAEAMGVTHDHLEGFFSACDTPSAKTPALGRCQITSRLLQLTRDIQTASRDKITYRYIKKATLSSGKSILQCDDVLFKVQRNVKAIKLELPEQNAF